MPLLWAIVIGWLPGAVLYRVPWFARDRRASLDADERLFWQVLISLAISLSAALALAALGRYSLPRVVVADLALALVVAVVVAASACGLARRHDGRRCGAWCRSR